MMRKMLIALALTLTAANLAIGAYASVCESSGGSRACGTTCGTLSDGSCGCTGGCSADELKWVDGANKGAGGEELLAE